MLTINHHRAGTGVCATLAAGLLLFAMTGCDQGSPEPTGTAGTTGTTPTPTAPAPPVNTSGPGKLTFASSQVNLGTIWDTHPVDGVFVFRNTGGEPVVIRDIKTSCGCTTTSLSQRLFQPGEEGSITITFDPDDKTGAQDKKVTIITDSGAPIEAAVVSNVRPFVNIMPQKYVLFEQIDLGETHRRTIQVSCPADPNFEIVKVDALVRGLQTISGEDVVPWFSANVIDNMAPPAAGATASAYPEIEVVIDESAPWGTVYGTVLVTVKGAPEPGAARVTHTAKVVVNASVRGDLMIDGQRVSVGVVPPYQPFEASTLLRRLSRKPFTVKSATIERSTSPGVTVTATPAGGDAWRITVRGTAGQLDTQINGFIRVVTDVPGEEQVDVRFTGVVKQPVQR